MKACFLLFITLISFITSIACEMDFSANHAEDPQDKTIDFIDDPTGEEIDQIKESDSNESFVTNGIYDLMAKGIATKPKHIEDANSLIANGLNRMRIVSDHGGKAHKLIDVTENAEDEPTQAGEIQKKNRIRGTTQKSPASNVSTTNDQRNLHLTHHHHHSDPTPNFDDDHNKMINRSFELPPARYHEFSMPNTTPEDY